MVRLSRRSWGSFTHRRTPIALAGLVVIACGACGGGGDSGPPPPPPPPPECVVDADCPMFEDLCNPVFCAPSADKKGGKCEELPPVQCDDKDPCTEDQCDPATGTCHSSPVTLDSDGDGHRAPLPGHVAGAPGACGDDCDDTNPQVYPGAQEVCDGADNDCNSIVDDDSHWVPENMAPVRVDGDIAPAAPGGLAFSGNVYASIYSGTTASGSRVFTSMLEPDGAAVVPPGEAPITLQNADAAGGPIVWAGDRFGVAFQDRRSSDYEIYFALLGEDGAKKFAGDVQLTFTNGFSVNPSLAWNQNEFIVVWQDDRGGLFDLYGQRVDHDGNPIGGNIQLTHANTLGNESPSVAPGVTTVGVASNLGDALSRSVQFQLFSADLTMALSPPLPLTNGQTDAASPAVVWNKDRYVIAWYDRSANPKAIYAAAVSEAGAVMVQPKAITNPGAFRSRYPFMRPLGDRLLLVYADDRDQNSGYELYTELISAALDPMGPEQRITSAGGDSLYPIAAFGPNGDVGILFRDDQVNAEHHVFFTRLVCVAGMGP